MLVRWRRLVAFDLGFWARTLVVGEDHAITGLRAPSDDLRMAEAFFGRFLRALRKGWQSSVVKPTSDSDTFETRRMP